MAVAKHVGLQILRLSGDIILPFNTTHYSLELQSYLDRYSCTATLDNVSPLLSVGWRNSRTHYPSMSILLLYGSRCRLFKLPVSDLMSRRLRLRPISGNHSENCSNIKSTESYVSSSNTSVRNARDMKRGNRVACKPSILYGACISVKQWTPGFQGGDY